MSYRHVNEADIEAWLAGLFLKGTLPESGQVWWHPKKVDIPVLEIEKDVTVDGNITLIRHTLKVRFNKHGRAQKLYKEWPKAIQMSEWTHKWYEQHGLATTTGDTITLINGRDTGQAVYKRRDGSYIYTLQGYEGTVK